MRTNIGTLTRRRLTRILTAAALGRSASADTAGADRLTWDSEPSGGRDRRYRAHAQILVLTLPLVRWPNVGGGSAVWRESAGPGNVRLRLLEFIGYSRPERAAGMNRLGFIRELSRISGDAAESLYFGVMTASPEETAEEARKSLHSTAKDVTYTAIDGRMAAGEVNTVVAHFSAPAKWSIENRNDLVQRSRQALSDVASRPPDFAPGAAPLRPFLQTLADALRRPAPVEARFSYAGRLYLLSLQKAEDPKAAATFHSRGVIAGGVRVVRVSGKLRRAAGGKETDFRLWIEEGAPEPLPLRIEYQARSFLRLVFEAET